MFLNKHKTKINYLFAGGFNTFVGLATFPLLYIGLHRFNVHYMAVLIISQIICVSGAFFMYKYFVFKTKGNLWREFLKFSTFYMVYFVFNILLMPLMVEGVGMNPIITQALISIGIIVSSFIWHSKITFTTLQNEEN